jgi:peptide/nickel transport system permease protein
MTTTLGVEPAAMSSTPRRRRSLRNTVIIRAARTPKGTVGLSLVLLILGIAIFGPLFSPYPPNEIVPGGFPFGGPDGHHLLGTDELGRDVLSRVLNGGLELIILAVIAAGLATLVGGLLGLLAAYRGGFIDTVIMRICDLFLSFPQLVFVLLMESVFGTHVWLLVVSVATSQAPALARVMRSAALETREREFVQAVQLWRPGGLKVILGEVLPNVSGPFLVEIGLRLTYAIIVIAGVSFLGLGIQPPSSNWALMIGNNETGIDANVWSVVVPAALIATLTVGVNMFTDAVSRVVLRGSGVVVEMISMIDTDAAVVV